MRALQIITTCTKWDSNHAITMDHDIVFFLVFVTGWDMCSTPTSFHMKSSKQEWPCHQVDEKVTWILHVQNWIIWQSPEYCGKRIQILCLKKNEGDHVSGTLVLFNYFKWYIYIYNLYLLVVVVAIVVVVENTKVEGAWINTLSYCTNIWLYDWY